VELADIIQMTDTHPNFETSIPIHSPCLETKSASFDIKNKMSGEVASATGGLLNGDFDVESLLAELTIDEKALLLSGIVVISSHCLEHILIMNRKGLLAHSGHPETEDSVYSYF
jgi:hypothetical protein